MGKTILLLLVFQFWSQTTSLLALPTGQQQEQKPDREQSASVALTNNDVLQMLKAGLAPSIVVAKIRNSKCAFDTSPAALEALKSARVPDDVLLVMVETPSGEAKAQPPRRATDELIVQFKRWQNSVVTVWSEFGHGTGFIVDRGGLVLTNQHVVGPSEYIAIQFDERRKLPAVLLAADPEKDVAVLWTNLAAVPEAIVAPLGQGNDNQPTVVEGERVFTIGSPRAWRKIFTSGVVSKVEARAIISDIQIDRGNSGGPLFNSQGVVAGITTFIEGRLSGIVRIEEVAPLLVAAKAKMATTQPPKVVLLPVEPTDTFPLEAIKETLQESEFDWRPYQFEDGDYDVEIITPPLKYYDEYAVKMQQARQKESRTRRKKEAVTGTYRPLEDLKNWEEYVGEYKPVIEIRASPKLRETFSSALGRGLQMAGQSLGGQGGALSPAQMRFKADFYRMRLVCGEKEIQPILPGKVASLVNVRNPFVRMTDATYEGLYSYPADAISPDCVQVALELYSEEKPNHPEVKVLSEKTVEHVWSDFAPYREPHPTPLASGGTDTGLAVLPSALSFGPVLVGESRTLSLTLTNVSGEPLTTIRSSSKGSIDFVGTPEPTWGSKLKPSESCAYMISFTPSRDGPEDGMILLSGIDGRNATVGLSGSGTEVTLSANSLNFGDVPEKTSTAKQVKIKNHGVSAVTFNASAGGSAVFSESDECRGLVAAHSSCALTVTFTPVRSGSYGNALTINTSDAGSPALKLSLKGTAIDGGR
jgi:S1-C subfamily serine protease